MFKDKLRELMQSNEISGKKLSEMTGLTPALISNYLKGKRNPTTGSVEKLAAAFDVPVSTFFADGDTHDDVDRIPTLSIREAANALGVPESFVKQGLKQSRFAWGYAVQNEDGSWAYFINRTNFDRIEGIMR